jgi:hypothetical protein
VFYGLTAPANGRLLGATRHSSSAVSLIIVAGLIMAAGIVLAVKRRQVADYFIGINGESQRAVNVVLFRTGIPLMALMFTVFGAIFEVYGWVKLL